MRRNARVRKKARDELQRALAEVVGEEGIAGAPTGIGARTIHFTVKETSAELWRCIQKGEIEIPAWRISLNIDTVSNDLMAPHVLRFTTEARPPTGKSYTTYTQP